MNKTPTHHQRYDIESVSRKLIECITDIFDHFDLPYTDSSNTISFPCPIHGGDNEFGSSILKEDIGNWQCYTQGCHEEHGTSILQFIQALLSVMNNKKHSFYDAIKWSANFVGETKTHNARQDDKQEEITEFIHLCKYINHNRDNIPQFTPRKLVRKLLNIPSSYYIGRGYSKNILDKFDVGYCDNINKPFYGRIVVPCYDDLGEYMVGCTSRSLYDKCPKCNLHHDLNVRCPITKQEKIKCIKWKHSSNLDTNNYLYNFWNAKEHILNTSTVFLVEGPGDVWRFEEIGIYNSLALLKAGLSRNQRYILESSGAINIVVATDNDDAGNKAFNTILQQCGKMFSVYRFKYDSDDIGSMEYKELKQCVDQLKKEI